MSRSLTASDRSSLIKLASSLPAGSAERKVILAQIGGKASRTASSPNALTRHATKLAESVAKKYRGFLTQPVVFTPEGGAGIEVAVTMMTPVLQNIFDSGEYRDMPPEGEFEAEDISKDLARAFGGELSSMAWEADDQVGYIFTWSFSS